MKPSANQKSDHRKDMAYISSISKAPHNISVCDNYITATLIFGISSALEKTWGNLLQRNPDPTFISEIYTNYRIVALFSDILNATCFSNFHWLFITPKQERDPKPSSYFCSQLIIDTFKYFLY